MRELVQAQWLIGIDQAGGLALPAVLGPKKYSKMGIYKRRFCGYGA